MASSRGAGPRESPVAHNLRYTLVVLVELGAGRSGWHVANNLDSRVTGAKVLGGKRRGKAALLVAMDRGSPCLVPNRGTYFSLYDQYGYVVLDYDADGLGAGVRGDARRIGEDREEAGQPEIHDTPIRESGAE